MEAARFHVLTELPGGGTADVYAAAAMDGGEPRLVVLKALRPAFEADAELVRMFRHEAHLAARIQHPNVVAVHEIVEDRGRPVLVMEFLDGASLRELERAAAASHVRLPLRGRIEALLAIARGLHFCHELCDDGGHPLGVVHRDVSPHNVFVTVDGHIKLLDFGIAKIQGQGEATQTGMVKGKLRYMAPEQMLGYELDRRADIYALGVMLWEAMAGRPMWAGVPDTVLMGRIVNGDIPIPDPVVPGCPAELHRLVRDCLALDPADRPPTCAAVAEALEQVLASMPEDSTTLAHLAAVLFADRRHHVQDRLRGRTEPRNEQSGSIAWQVARSDVSRSIPAHSRRGFWMTGVIVTLVAAVGTWRAWPLGGRGRSARGRVPLPPSP